MIVIYMLEVGLVVEKYSKSKEESKNKLESDKKFEEFISESIEVEEIIIPQRDEIHERKRFEAKS